MPSALLNNLLVFARLLRTLGIDVHLGRLLDATDALQHVDIGSRDDVYHTLRALFVHRHDHLATFDAAFDAFWRDVAHADLGLASGSPQLSAAATGLSAIAQLRVVEEGSDEASGTREVGM